MMSVSVYVGVGAITTTAPHRRTTAAAPLFPCTTAQVGEYLMAALRRLAAPGSTASTASTASHASASHASASASPAAAAAAPLPGHAVEVLGDVRGMGLFIGIEVRR